MPIRESAEQPGIVPAGPAPGGTGGLMGADEPRGWHDLATGASVLNLLAGLWLIMAPFVLGYPDGEPVLNDVICGVIVTVVAFLRLTDAWHLPQLSFINVAVGAWLFAASFWLDSSNESTANDRVMGIVVVVLALVTALIGMRSQRTRAAR